MFNIPISNNTTPAMSMDALMGGGNTPVATPSAPMSPPVNPVPTSNSVSGPGFAGFDSQPIPVQPQSTPVQPAPQPQMVQSMGSAPTFTSNPRPSGGGVSLSKGQKVSLSKMNAALDMIEVGLGWDVMTNSAVPYDLDAEAFMLGANGKVLSDDWFIFYNQPCSPDGSCRHMGDNKDGNGVGDDEVIQLQLSRVNPQVAKIAFVVSINEALQRGHNFGGVQNAYVRVVDKSTNKELIKFNLTDYFKEVTSMTVGELYLKNGEWRFNAVGQGLNTDLAGLCGFYGVNIC